MTTLTEVGRSMFTRVAGARRAKGRNDIVLGTPVSPYPHREYRLTPAMQRYHTLCLGATGMGKSKFLQSVCVQHIMKDHAVGLLDPHGQTARDTLAYLAAQGYFERPDAFERLVYLRFGGDADRTIPFNVLRQPHAAAEDIAENLRDAFTRVWPELSDQAVFGSVFPSAIVALVASRRTLVDLPRLLRDKEFREQCTAGIVNPTVREALSVCDTGRGDPASGPLGATIRRVFEMTFHPVAYHALGQPDTVLDFRKLMDAGRSVLLDFGDVRNDLTRRFLAALCLTLIERAALSRSDMPPAAMTPATYLIDEWPAIAPTQRTTLENILSQARKYKLALTLVGQHADQINAANLGGALDNCRLTILMGLGRRSAEILAPLVTDLEPSRPGEKNGSGDRPPSMAQQKAAWVSGLQNLPPRHAVVKAQGKEAVLLQTLTVHDPDPAAIAPVLTAVMDEYRQRYTRPVGPGPSGATGTPSQPAPAPAPATAGTGAPAAPTPRPARFVDDDDPVFGDPIR